MMRKGRRVWVLWPKKASGTAGDLTMVRIREMASAVRSGGLQGLRGGCDLVRDDAGKAPQPILFLEHIPKELIVDFVVILHFRRLHERAQQPRAAVRRRLLQVRVSPLHVFT